MPITRTAGRTFHHARASKRELGCVREAPFGGPGVASGPHQGRLGRDSRREHRWKPVTGSSCSAAAGTSAPTNNAPVGSHSDERDSRADPTLAVAARNLALDAATAQIFETLRTADLPAILLKGPVTTRWLYAAGEPRGYSDIDILVPPERIRGHEQVLRDLGFHKLRMDWFVGEGQAISWKRGDDVFVDVHTSLWGASAPGDRQWAIVQARADHMDLAGTQVPVPDLATKAFLVATHVAKDGSRKPKPMQDLDRALARLSLTDWRLAAEIAAELGGTDAFSWGLRLTDRGAEVAEALGLPEVSDVELILRNENTDRLSRWFFKDHAGLRPKLRLLVGAVAPTPFAMKVRYSLARRGRGGLVAAYLVRPFHLLWWGVTSIPYWMEARRRGSHAR